MTSEIKVRLKFREKAKSVYESLASDAYQITSNQQTRTKKTTDDQFTGSFSSKSELTTTRNRSSIPVRQNESDVRLEQKNQDPRKTDEQMKQLGFGKEFLSFPEEVRTKKPALEANALEIIKNNQFENLDDIDFRSNNFNNQVENQFLNLDRSPSFSDSIKRTANEQNRGQQERNQKSNEINLLDF